MLFRAFNAFLITRHLHPGVFWRYIQCVYVCLCACCFQDGLLSISEIMDKIDMVKVSTITDYGILLVKEHDEL